MAGRLRWMRRRWFRGRVAPRRRQLFRLIPALAGVGLALAVIGAADAAVRPVLTELAAAKARNMVTALVNRAVEDAVAAGELSYEDVVRFQTGSGGQITAMTTDTAALNRLRTGILDRVVREVDALGTEELGIPLGNLTGLSALSGWGPPVPVQVLETADAGAEFEHVFTSAGINQTLHRVMLHVTVTVRLLIPGGTEEVAVDTQVCIAETVIVGEVPGTYLELPMAP